MAPTRKQNLIWGVGIGLISLAVYFLLKPEPIRLSRWIQSPDLLSHLDVAEINLECAKGLKGSEDLDVTEVLSKLDKWSADIKDRTDKLMSKFYLHPEEYKNSEAYFRMLAFVTILQQDYAVQYKVDPLFRLGINASLPNELFFKNSRDIFIHGITSEARQGTCASLPVLYVALGRRIGYPLKLVSAKQHLFVRWDDGKERFNIEATTEGFFSEPDDYYKSWPEIITEAEISSGQYLKNMTTNQELAAFLGTRSVCQISNNQFEEGRRSLQQACQLDPSNDSYGIGLLYLSQFNQQSWEARKKPLVSNGETSLLSNPRLEDRDQSARKEFKTALDQMRLENSNLDKIGLIQRGKLSDADIQRMEIDGKIDHETAAYLGSVSQGLKAAQRRFIISDVTSKIKDGSISRSEVNLLLDSNDPVMINLYNDANRAVLGAEIRRTRENFERIKRLNEESRKKLNQH